MTRNLGYRKVGVGLAELKNSLVEAQRKGDRDLARRFAQLIEAERRGDHELVTQIRDSLVASAPIVDAPNRKQVE